MDIHGYAVLVANEDDERKGQLAMSVVCERDGGERERERQRRVLIVNNFWRGEIVRQGMLERR